MNEFVTDAHPLIWHLTQDKRLSERCRQIFAQTDAGEMTIWIPVIVIVEMIFLVEKNRFPKTLIEQVYELLAPPTSNYRLYPLDVAVLHAVPQVDKETVPEMPDRIIAATALSLGLPLMSRDHRITALSVIDIVWE